jgi:CspA family cold shock protein
MSVFSRLAISILVAAIATAAVVYLGLGDIKAGIAIVAATIAVALLPGTSGAADAQADEWTDERADYDAQDRETGKVKWFNVSKGFGFIIRDNGEEIFVHFRSIQGSGKGRRALRDGQQVSYRVAQSDKGPQAEDVEPLD